jgi:hypothetical protein
LSPRGVRDHALLRFQPGAHKIRLNLSTVRCSRAIRANTELSP